jgi:hypothetical protein
LLGLFFDPEDGNDIFLRNIGLLLANYTRHSLLEIEILIGTRIKLWSELFQFSAVSAEAIA